MVLYLGFLLVLGVWKPLLTDLPRNLFHINGDLTLLWRGILIVAIYSILDLGIGYWREKKWILPSSAWISGLILAVVLSPGLPWGLTVAAPVLASFSKQFLKARRRHVFNPAAFALVTLGFFAPNQGVISWWGASWGLLPLVVVALSGIVTIIRVKRWKTTLAFLAVYGIGGAFLLAGGQFATGLKTLLWDGTAIFFSTVMLIEPVTTSYTPVFIRTWFGAAVGILVLLFSLPGSPTVPDPFLVSLLLGNLGATVASRLVKR
jgi:Na+-translocating ferredoxin:NAD+ oxidoreductase RnfD subunit